MQAPPISCPRLRPPKSPLRLRSLGRRGGGPAGSSSYHRRCLSLPLLPLGICVACVSCARGREGRDERAFAGIPAVPAVPLARGGLWGSAAVGGGPRRRHVSGRPVPGSRRRGTRGRLLRHGGLTRWGFHVPVAGGAGEGVRQGFRGCGSAPG